MRESDHMYYRVHCGTREHQWWGGDDRTARQKVARWLRRFGKQLTSDFFSTECVLERTWCATPGIVPHNREARIEYFDVTPETIAEFVRVYA